MRKIKSIAEDFNSRNRNIKKKYIVQVGLFDNERYEVAVKHEFGSITKKIPQRSFLRVPLESFVRTIIAPAKNTKGIMDGKAIADQIGTRAVIIINEAFKTRGFGLWKPLAPYTKRFKEKFYPASADLILVQTGELRASIVYKVK